MKLYAIDEGQLAAIRQLQTRLHSEERMNGDQMRDAGHTLQAIVDIVSQLEIPDAPALTAPDDVVFDVRMERKTFNRLRQAMTVRAMAAETAGLPDAFVLKFLALVDAGEKTYYFKQKKNVT